MDLYKEELIYRGNYLVNWCPATQSAVSDLEVEQQEILSLKDKNGKDLEKASDLRKLMLVALDQKLVSILTKAIELGDLIITPVSNPNDPKESVLIERTTLLKVLYAR